MRILFFSFLLLISTVQLIAQPGAMLLKSFGGDQLEVLVNLVEMENGEIWSVGASGSNLQGNTDAWLLRTDDQLNCLGSHTYGSIGVDRAEAIVKDDQGNAYIIGYTNGFDAQEYDALIIKVNSQAEVQWIKNVGYQDWDFATCGAWLNDHLFIGGYSYSNPQVSSAWLVELDSDGEQISENFFGNGQNAWMNDIIATTDDYMVLAYTQTNDNFSDVNIVKLDAAGNEIWSYVRTETDAASELFSITQHNEQYHAMGKRVVGGHTSSFVLRLHESGILEEELIYEQSNDFYMVRALVTDTTRTFLMNTFTFGAGGCDGGFLNFNQFYSFESSVTFGGTNNDFMHDALISSNGKFIACGEYNSYSDQLSQGLLAALPGYNVEGYSYTLEDDPACFVVGINEPDKQEIIDYTGNWHIYDLCGKYMKTLVGTESQVKLQMSDFSVGIYLLVTDFGSSVKFPVLR